MTEFVLDKKLCIEPEYGSVIHDLVIKEKPSVCVEIGTGQGYSTSWILGALNNNKHGHCYTFDSVDRSPHHWEQEGISHARLKTFIGEFKTMESSLPKNIDFVFHDAGHWFEHLNEDLGMVLPRMSKGGVIAVHDIVYSKDMGERLKSWFEVMPEWSYQEMKDGCGLGIARRTK